MGFPLAYCSVFSSLMMACVAARHSLAAIGAFLILSLRWQLYDLIRLSFDCCMLVGSFFVTSLWITAPIV